MFSWKDITGELVGGASLASDPMLGTAAEASTFGRFGRLACCSEICPFTVRPPLAVSWATVPRTGLTICCAAGAVLLVADSRTDEPAAVGSENSWPEKIRFGSGPIRSRLRA
jgi:hypothetical protein